MASKTTLNLDNLERLSSRQLAELVMELASGSAEAKRKCRLTLASAQGTGVVAREVAKRLNTIRRSTTFVDWQKSKKLADDLNTQLKAITDNIAPKDPKEAASLLWRFLTLADNVLRRSDDSNGKILAVFDNACQALGPIEQRAKTPPETLAEQVFQALFHDHYGQCDELIDALAPALGETGLEALRQRFLAYRDESVGSDEEIKQVLEESGCDHITVEHYRAFLENRKNRMIDAVLEDIADQQEDLDTYIALQEDNKPYPKLVAADIGQRLLDAGRPSEAWEHINMVAGNIDPDLHYEWVTTRLAILDAMGEAEQAQAFRWQCFEHTLNPALLGEYLDCLPDFEDDNAERKALAHVATYPVLDIALGFLMQWRSQERARALAAELVTDRARELDGHNYWLLPDIADWLAATHPLAATRILRTMIDYTLEIARHQRYPYAAQHLETCAQLAPQISDYAGLLPHRSYVQQLQANHPRKRAFWQRVNAAA